MAIITAAQNCILDVNPADSVGTLLELLGQAKNDYPFNRVWMTLG